MSDFESGWWFNARLVSELLLPLHVSIVSLKKEKDTAHCMLSKLGISPRLASHGGGTDKSPTCTCPCFMPEKTDKSLIV